MLGVGVGWEGGREGTKHPCIPDPDTSQMPCEDANSSGRMQ